MKDSFVLYTKITETVEKLTTEQKGKLFQAILDYENGKEPIFDDLCVELVFTPIKQDLDVNTDKWEKTKEARKLAGSKGGKQKVANLANVANATFATNECSKKNFARKNVANVADNVYVYVNDNVNDNVNVSLKEKEKKEKEKENNFSQENLTEQDPFMSNKVHEFMDYFSKEFSKGKNAISREERIRLTHVLNDLEQQGYSIEEISETVCRNLKKTKFRGIDGTFNPGINWLLKDDARNFYVTMNGQFVPSYDSCSDDTYEVDEYGN